MRPVLAMARATILESVRDRVLYSVLLFALALLGAAPLLSRVPVGDRARYLVDFGLAGISFFGLCLSVLLGIGLVSKEIERKSLFWILVKPISRRQLLCGKYLGLLGVLALDLALMGACLVLLVRQSTGEWNPALLTNVAFLYLKFAIVTAVAVAFSCFSTPILSVLYTLAVYFIGHSTAEFRVFATPRGPAAAFVGEFLYAVLPNFDDFDLRKELLHRTLLPAGQVPATAAYAGVYVLLVLAIALYIFERREFH